MKHGGNIWDTNLFPNIIQLKAKPPTNMIQYSSKIEAKVMETSDSMAWECNLFTHEFIGFRPTEDMDIKLQSNTSYMAFPTSSNSYNIPHTNPV